jgi:hypothetical protein
MFACKIGSLASAWDWDHRRISSIVLPGFEGRILDRSSASLDIIKLGSSSLEVWILKIAFLQQVRAYAHAGDVGGIARND